MTGDMDINAELANLVDFWCDRRELACLRIILPAWPMPMGLTDEVHELYDALRHLKAMVGDRMPPNELDIVRRCLSVLERSLGGR